MLKNILEILAEIMGFLAGMSFIARVFKQLLIQFHIFDKYDKYYKEFIRKKETMLKRSLKIVP